MTKITKLSTMISNKYSAEDIMNGKQWENIVAVVRCKDCKFGKMYCTEDVNGSPLYECDNPNTGLTVHTQNYFCADGKLKD